MCIFYGSSWPGNIKSLTTEVLRFVQDTSKKANLKTCLLEEDQRQSHFLVTFEFESLLLKLTKNIVIDLIFITMLPRKLRGM